MLSLAEEQHHRPIGARMFAEPGEDLIAAAPGSALSGVGTAGFRGTLDEVDLVELGDQLRRFRECAGNDRLRNFKQLEHPLVGHGVPHRGAIFSRVHHVCSSQHGQLLRQMRGLKSDLWNQISHRSLAISKQLQDANSCGVREGLEEVGFNLVNGSRHRPDPCL